MLIRKKGEQELKITATASVVPAVSIVKTA